jgi:hypothetical protein
MLINKFFPACVAKEEFELCALCNVHVVLACSFFRVRYPRTINSVVTVRSVHILSVSYSVVCILVQIQYAPKEVG